MIRAALVCAAACLVPALPVWAQRAEPANPTRTTTIAALTAHPLFFSRQRARVEGEVIPELGGEILYLSDGTRRILLADTGGRVVAAGTRVEVTGTFWDVGRLQPDDGRLPTFDFRTLSRAVLNRDWSQRIEAIARRLPAEHALDTLARIEQAEADFQHYANKRLVLDSLLLGLWRADRA